MKFYNDKGVEIDLKQFTEGSIVVARITKPMGLDEFRDFCRGNEFISEEFSQRGIFLVFCPDWIEFKDWK